MIFIETRVFTRQVQELMSDDEYRALQLYLVENPDAGDVIQGAGGIRKVRVAASGHGKRGGARVIYYHFVAASRIALLMVYAKGRQDDLTDEHRKALKSIIENWR